MNERTPQYRHPSRSSLFLKPSSLSINSKPRSSLLRDNGTFFFGHPYTNALQFTVTVQNNIKQGRTVQVHDTVKVREDANVFWLPVV